MALQPVFPGALRRSPQGGAIAAAPPAVPEGESRLLVGAHVRVTCSDIGACDTVVVEGTLEASLSARMMRVAERGVFKGSAELETAEIRGLFDGELTVRDRLVVHATGEVAGKVRCGRLVVEEGARMSGEVSATTNEGESAGGEPA